MCYLQLETIQECVYNRIPVATMACSLRQFEQVRNEDKYVNKLKYAELI